MGPLASIELELPWTGKPLTGDTIGWDTETTCVDLQRRIPTLVCLTASDGLRKVVVFPQRVREFVAAHAHVRRWSAWNIGFDWWVVHRALAVEALGAFPESGWWRRAVNRGVFGDGMLLEQLVKLGEGNDKLFFQQGLKKAAKAYLDIEIEKDADIRQGFVPEMTAEGEWQKHMSSWSYAADDAAVTYLMDRELVRRAEAVIGGIPPLFTALGDWGLLTEQIQVRAAIALAQVTRNGILVRRDEATKMVAKYKDEAAAATYKLEQIIPGLVKVYGPRARKAAPGTRMMTKSGLPQFNQLLLRAYLERVAEDRKLDPPRTEKTQQITTTAEWWTLAAPDDPLVEAWQRLQDATAALEIALPLTLSETDRVHPRYEVVKRTGRTSAKGPPIQQTPRDAKFRELYVAPPGRLLVSCDYSYIELRTLAEICEKRLGYSKLAEVIRNGVDPHAHTARLLMGLDQLAWDVLPPPIKKEKRQAAKALNFGIPGGLGATKLQGYAKANYGVSLSAAEAAEFRHRVITEVYPEWSDWLRDGLSLRLAVTIGADPADVETAFGKDFPFGDPFDCPPVRILRGLKDKAKGGGYSKWYVEDIWRSWEGLLGEIAPKWVVDRVYNREGGDDLAEAIVRLPCVTLTGRSRRKTFYTEYRNTQFQGQASDGAKLALYDLTMEGFMVVAFIHDEILTEVDEEGAEENGRRIATIMSESFARSMPGGVPIACEYSIGRCWKKP